MNNSTSEPSPAVTPAPGVGPDVDAASPPAAASASIPSTPFPQAKGESDRAFEAFRAYLELGPKRRLVAVARKVGASLRTVQRWARDFDWRGRIKTCAAQGAGQYVETENTMRREALLDDAARAKAFRDRQFALAEAILDAAERHLELLEEDDLDQMSFADACRALVAASRFTGETTSLKTDPASTSDRGLRDQLTALLDQVCGQTPAPDRAAGPTDSKPLS